MFDMVRDMEGVRMALGEIFEEDFTRARLLRHLDGADEATRQRMASQVPQRTLSPGYYALADHLLRLEEEMAAHLPVSPSSLLWFEARGMVMVRRARNLFEGQHPKCSACGALQGSRFSVECDVCGAKFRKGH
jgi:hypothetical protein